MQFVRVGFKFIKNKAGICIRTRGKRMIKNLRNYHFKTANLWDVFGVDAVNGVAHVLPGGNQQGEPQQADHWTQDHVRNCLTLQEINC